MIHKWEQKNNIDRKRTDFSAELSEEQIARLIAEVEEKEMLPAPRHLKEDVFGRITRQKKVEREKKLLSYRTQVLVTVAASLAVLILLPAEGRSFARYQKLQEQAAKFREEAMDSSWDRYVKQEERKWQKQEYSVETIIQDLLQQGGLSDEEKEK